MADLIERQAAIDALMAWEEGSVWDEECLKHRGEPYWVAPSDVIEQLPSAQPEPQWIPCSEQEYPSDNREVEVTCEFTRYDGKKCRYTCHASYVHRYTVESTSYDNWEDCEEYNEEKDMYYALPGWYERIHNWDDYSCCAIEDRVVAWRELSEPWRGEEHGET